MHTTPSFRRSPLRAVGALVYVLTAHFSLCAGQEAPVPATPSGSETAAPVAWMAFPNGLIRADGSARVLIDTAKGKHYRVGAWNDQGKPALTPQLIPETRDMDEPIPRTEAAVPVGNSWLVAVPYKATASDTRRTKLKSKQSLLKVKPSGEPVYGPPVFNESPCAARLSLLREDGSLTTLGTGNGDHLLPVATPSGQFAAALVWRDRRWQLARFDCTRGSEVLFCRLPDAGKNQFPIQDLSLSADGQTAWFARTSAGRLAIHAVASKVENVECPRPLIADPKAHCFAPVPSPSGTQVGFIRRTNSDAVGWHEGDECWLAGADGQGAHLLVAPATGERVCGLAWLDDEHLSILLQRRLPTANPATPTPTSVAITPGFEPPSAYRMLKVLATSGATISESVVDLGRMLPR